MNLPAIVGAVALAPAAWQWWGMWRGRRRAATLTVGQPTSTRTVNVLGLIGGVLLAGSLGPLLRPAAALIETTPAAWPPKVVTATLVIAALDLGCRGLGLWPTQLCPQLKHFPIAVLLPIITVAAWPLVQATVADLKAATPTAEAAESTNTAPQLVATCTVAPRPDDASIGGLRGPQLANADLIVAVGRELGVPPRGELIAVATAAQESSLINRPDGHSDSAGLLQQRPSQGWGTYAQVTDPRYAATTFYRHLLALPGWQELELTDAAQAVQRSAHPGAYAKWEAPAADVIASAAITCTPTTK